MYRSYILLLIIPVLVTLGQLLLKRSTAYIVTNEGFLKLIKSMIRLDLFGAAFCVSIAPLLYILSLQKVPLSKAFAFNSLNYIFVFTCGRVFLKEKINFQQVIGVMLISTGFLIPFIVEVANA